MPRLLALCLTSTLLTLSASAQTPDLTKVTSRAQLDAVIAATGNAALKQALQTHASAILAAAALLDFLTPEARAKVLGGNAARLFGFKVG
ncbi:MAG: hypothetical protein EXS27_00125 [Pedosphaera sp.]|nr:hypothetical protein [Pedosphaera sp.]